MPRHPFFTPALLLTAGLSLVAFSAASAQQLIDSPSGQVVSKDDRARLELQTFSFINQYRKANALPQLQWDGAIAQVARGHSRDMAVGGVDFGHDGFNQRVTQLKTAMPGLSGAGENVLRTNNPEEVARFAVDVWLKSPHHLKNIRGDFNCSGMGIWVDDKGMIYFTQIFVKTEPPKQEAQAAPPPQLITPFGLLATPKTR